MEYKINKTAKELPTVRDNEKRRMAIDELIRNDYEQIEFAHDDLVNAKAAYHAMKRYVDKSYPGEAVVKRVETTVYVTKI